VIFMPNENLQNGAAQMLKPVYKKILLKLSGESLAGGLGTGIDVPTVLKICEPIRECARLGVQIGIVVGGGNFWRGRTSDRMDRTRADHIGMLATAMNALALTDALESLGVDARVQTAIEMSRVAEPYIRGRAIHHLEKGRVVVFGCGTGNPFFSTDTAAALRAAEIEAEVIFKATNVDGVYDSDPRKNPDAVKYDTLSYSDVLSRKLEVMDSTAASLCRDNGIPILVFNLGQPQNILRAVLGEQIGTLVQES
jgi:uridylate kinase